MTETPPTPSRTAGTITLVLGLLALALYAFLGAEPEGEADVPASRFVLAALLVITGVALRAPGTPRWAVFVAATLGGLIALDLLSLFW